MSLLMDACAAPLTLRELAVVIEADRPSEDLVSVRDEVGIGV